MLRTRWLGRVPYHEASQLQRALHHRAADDYLLLLEHPHIYTLGTTANPEHVLVPPAQVGAELVWADRGGDVTYHGPGQLIGYPIVTLPEWRDGMRDVVAYVRALEDVLIAAMGALGVAAVRESGFTGVWANGEKVAAIGVKVSRGRTRHGFALNVDPDLSMFDHIVPCGTGRPRVTSLAAILGGTPDRQRVIDVVAEPFADRFGYREIDSQGLARRDATTDVEHLRSPAHAPVRLLGRLAEAGVTAEVDPTARRPEWMRVRADLGADFRATQRLMRTLDLNTVCEEAGCPNIYECWAD